MLEFVANEVENLLILLSSSIIYKKVECKDILRALPMIDIKKC